MNGIIVIDKPRDYTSFDVVAVMRKICSTKKVGHTGTLDPMVTGVLPILVGNATKTLSLLKDTDKTYIANFKLGIRTDTQDIWGKVLDTKDFKVTKSEVTKALYSFKGDIMQIPPMYSSVKHNGVRLYDLARKGIEVEREARKAYISSLLLLYYNEDTGEGSFEITCSKGTYIRTLCDDLGTKLSNFAVMTNLRRTMACSYTLSDCITLEEARSLKENGQLEQYLKPTDQILNYLKKINVSANQAIRFKNGGPLNLDRLKFNGSYSEKQCFRVYSPKNDFLGIGIISTQNHELSILKIF